MIRRLALATAAFAWALSLLLVNPLNANAAFNQNNIMSDTVFNNSSAMSASQIDGFLNAFSSSCISTNRGFSSPDVTGYNPSQGYLYGSNVSAGTIIAHAAQAYDLNPQVILATLQKEQSLVSGSAGCHYETPPTLNPCPNPPYGTHSQCVTACQYAGGCVYIAEGYDCPYYCATGSVGFSKQIIKAAWKMKFVQQRSLGNYSWNVQKPGWDNSDDPLTSYDGAMTQGYLKRNASSTPFQYDGNRTVNSGSLTVHLDSGATASLYSYTPFTNGNQNFVTIFENWFGSTTGATLISFKSHLSNVGWTYRNLNGGMTGTTGQNRPMEAFKINGEIEYTSYNYTTGWQPTVNRGMISGTTGINRSIQAIKINPLGSLASSYDIYYAAHVSNIGWMGWTKNGQAAGITGSEGDHIEAFQIYLAPKGAAAPGPTNNSYQNDGVATYSPSISLGVTSHVATVGWQPTVTETMVSGTTEQGKQIEAFKIALNNTTGIAGSIKYSAHLAGTGWQSFKSSGETAGTTGQARQVEAFRIALSGDLGDSYDVWYRSHVEKIGWLDWAKNGEAAGSVGAGYQLEAFEVRIVPKNSTSLSQLKNLHNPKNQALPDSYTINYSAHVSNIGWINNIKQNAVGGTTGQSKALEAIKINSSLSIFGNIVINCSAYVKGTGWISDVIPGNTCGTTGQSKALESLKLSLTGEAANKYDIYYKAHVSTVGWINWVKNNAQTGSPGSNKQVEAVIIKLVQK